MPVGGRHRLSNVQPSEERHETTAQFPLRAEVRFLSMRAEWITESQQSA